LTFKKKKESKKFVKKYENLAEKAIEAFRQYDDEVHSGLFPKEEHAYKMMEGELPKLKNLLADSE
jgi:3-methyl-2-oxobutanoate hydroxymethyltransferase